VDISALVRACGPWKQRLDTARQEIGDDIPWYLYDILGNVPHVDALLHGEHRDLDRFAAGLPVADIGSADGDLAFMLEGECGWELDIVDTAATNMNGLRGAHALKQHLCSRVNIADINLDEQFRLPRERYGLILLLGILYHLQNPFYVLRALAQHANYCLLSTRVVRLAGSHRTFVADLPVAYLVSPIELNNDASNYWMFSPTGLERIVSRAGWTMLERHSVGDTIASDPSSMEHDERTFMLLRSG
jgi:hypothetical protein